MIYGIGNALKRLKRGDPKEGDERDVRAALFQETERLRARASMLEELRRECHGGSAAWAAEVEQTLKASEDALRRHWT